MLRLVRCYTTTTNTVKVKRPPLTEVLPSKRTLQKMLFDYDARLNYRKYVPTITKIYDNMDTNDLIPVPNNIKGRDLMLFRNVLKEIRTKTHTINKNLLRLENELIEYSADLGDNNAVSILLFECLKNPDINTQQDIDHAKDLIKELLSKKHPLSLKLIADLSYQAKNIPDALRYYQDFLQLENDTMLLAEVYQSLGMILFKEKDLNKLEFYFQRAIKLTTLDKLSYSYFHLGVIYEDDPKLSRYYFEMAASQGLVESFPNLGFLEMSVFNNVEKLIEWFKLGVELGDFNSLIGLFDSYMSLKDFILARRIYTNIESMLQKRPQLMSLETFHEIRHDSLQILNNHFIERENTIQTTTTTTTTDNDGSKWDI